MAHARFFAYIFFRASKHSRCTEEEKDVQVSSFFEQWMNTHQLKEESVFDLGQPDLTLARTAEKEGHSIAVLHFGDIDILEIERRQILPDEDPFAFWERCLEACRVGGCYFGAAHALSFPSDEIFKESIREMACAEIPGTGFLYRMGAKNFLMISPKKKPAEFLGRDFPAIASIFQKFAFQEDVSKEVKRKSRGYRREIERLTAPERLKDIETNFNDVKKNQTYLQDNLISLSKVRETFDINILRNYLKTLDIRTDTLFAPVIRKAGKVRQQLSFDMNHARLNLDRVNGQLRLLELRIENQRINDQNRIKQLITIIGVTIGIGQVAANEDWDVKLLVMCIAMLIISLIMWFLNKGK